MDHGYVLPQLRKLHLYVLRKRSAACEKISGELIEQLADRMVATGIPLSRLLVFVHSLHPQVAGVRYTWLRDSGRVQVWRAPHSAIATAVYRDSPVSAIIEGAADRIRRRRPF